MTKSEGRMPKGYQNQVGRVIPVRAFSAGRGLPVYLRHVVEAVVSTACLERIL